MSAITATRPAGTAGARCVRAPLIYVTGGKGGVGKTVLSVNLAAALARGGARVLLADLDLGLADADVLLRHCSARGLLDVLAGGAPLKECVSETAHGFDFLAGVSGERAWSALGDERRDALLDGLRDVATGYDLVVLDGASGIGEDVLALAAACDRVLLVTTPDPTALTDGYGLLKALHERGEALGPEIPTPEVVVNRARDLVEAEGTAQRLRHVAERFLARSPRWAGWLPESVRIHASCREQRPFGGERGASSAHACLDQLAARFTRSLRAAHGGAR